METRRIDLLVDAAGKVPALAHELTHIVLADRFGAHIPPRWFDEGIATMADSVKKQTLHDRDCWQALRTGTALRVVDLLRLERFTSAEQAPAFYGQSLSLVHFLAEQGEPATIVDFVEAAMIDGYDRALKKYYDIDDVASLESRWRQYAAARMQARAKQEIAPFRYHALTQRESEPAALNVAD